MAYRAMTATTTRARRTRTAPVTRIDSGRARRAAHGGRHSALASPGWLGCIWGRRTAELSVPSPRVSVCQALGVGRGAGGLGALLCPIRGSDLARRVVLAALPRGPRTAAAATDRDTESPRGARQ